MNVGALQNVSTPVNRGMVKEVDVPIVTVRSGIEVGVARATVLQLFVVVRVIDWV